MISVRKNTVSKTTCLHKLLRNENKNATTKKRQKMKEVSSQGRAYITQSFRHCVKEVKSQNKL